MKGLMLSAAMTVLSAVLATTAVSTEQRRQDIAGDKEQRPITPSAASTFKAPRTPWGDPDLQGTWPSGPLMTVPFERPPDFGTRAVLSAEEVAARDAAIDRAVSTPAPPQAFLQPFWNEYGRAPALTSLIVDPENGRLPDMTTDGARRAREWQMKAAPNYPYAGPQDMRPYDRCITRGVLGSAFPNVYSAGMQILQAPGVVMVRHEMIHEARVIPLDGRPHLPVAMTSYMGDPRGRWDGETLVVETTNFNGKTGSYARNGDGNPTSPALRLVERFRLTDRDTLQYEVRVEDPQTWVRPWTVAFPLRRDESYVLYEYACHEGNYAIRHVLSAARAAER
jgi:hypothetical protein